MSILWRTEKRIVKDLKFYEQNPRTIKVEQFAKLKKSIDTIGYVEIVAIDTDNTICAGHMRVRALIDLGKIDEEIDVRVPERKLTKEEFETYLLMSNRVTGEWDWDKLANNYEIDFLKQMGFDEKDLGMLDSDTTDEKDEAIPDVHTETTVVLGDIYQLGPHRIMCGSSTDEGAIEKLINGKSLKLIFTSPPYNMGANMYANYADDMKSEKYIDFNIEVITKYAKYLKGFLFWNISYNKKSRSEFIDIMYRMIKETGLSFMELIVWNKKHAMPITAKDMLTRQYEDILAVGDKETISQELELFVVGKNEKMAYFNKRSRKSLTNYWEVNTNKTQLDNHKACFPVALPLKGINLMTVPGDIVCDPFLGSGSTMIAAEKASRVCYGMEMDPLYVDVCLRRYEEYTGKKAEKITSSPS